MSIFDGLLADKIIHEAPNVDQRTGQYLFNTLAPPEAREAVAGTLFDPFYKDLTREELVHWLHEHIVFNDGGRVIGVVDTNHFLWEDKT